MKKILPYVKPYLLQIVVLVGLIVVQVMTDLALPDYLARIINEGIVLQDNSIVIEIGLEMLGVASIGAVATIIVGYLAAKVSTGLARDLRSAVFEKTESFSLAEFDKFSTSSLITRTTNDIQQVQMVSFMLMRIVISAPILGISAVFKAYANAPGMSWVIGLAVGIMVMLIVVIFLIALPKFKVLQKFVDRINLIARQNLTGLRVIRAFNTQKDEEQKFDEANVDLTRVNLFVNKIMMIMQPLMFLIFNLTAVAVVWFGAQLIDAGELEIGNMLAFMQYAMQVIMSFLMLTMMFIIIPRSAVSIQRVGEVLGTELSIKDNKIPKKLPESGHGAIEFQDVAFSYPDSEEPVLKHITFTAVPGETTAFIGSTGSGKSTLINLIPRFYDVSSGRILIDGVDIRDISQEDLHDKIGYVPQKGVLFSGTIESNIKYGVPNATESDIEEAAQIAQAKGFIDELDEKYQNPISQGGTNVSGGQKQRLAIARAIIKKPDIYIFDDSFSAVDFKTDIALRKALSEQTKNSTVLIVAQRISTILHADKIVVLDEGDIVGQGTHDELIKSCEVYQEIASSQLTSEELDEVEKKGSING